MTKLHVDINRSIAYYRTTLNGTSPKRVFLTGGSSQLPYLDLFIADKLALPVAFFNPLHNVTLGQALASAHLQQNNCFHNRRRSFGLALRQTGSCPAEVHLEALTFAARADKKRKRNPAFFAALLRWILILRLSSAPIMSSRSCFARQDARSKLATQTSSLQVVVLDIVKLSAQADASAASNDRSRRLSGSGQERNTCGLKFSSRSTIKSPRVFRSRSLSPPMTLKSTAAALKGREAGGHSWPSQRTSETTAALVRNGLQLGPKRVQSSDRPDQRAGRQRA